MTMILGRRGVLAASAVLLSATLATAAAQATQTPVQEAQPKTPDPTEDTKMSIAEIAKSVEAQGYRDIDEIEFEGSFYEVCAKDASGKKVELTVNASTGRVEKVEPRDD